MANEVKVKPTPIQRNRFDVAMELTKMHFEYGDAEFREKNIDKLDEIFARYYAIAEFCERRNPVNFVPQDTHAKFQGY